MMHVVPTYAICGLPKYKQCTSRVHRSDAALLPRGWRGTEFPTRPLVHGMTAISSSRSPEIWLPMRMKRRPRRGSNDLHLDSWSLGTRAFGVRFTIIGRRRRQCAESLFRGEVREEMQVEARAPLQPNKSRPVPSDTNEKEAVISGLDGVRHTVAAGAEGAVMPTMQPLKTHFDSAPPTKLFYMHW